MIDHTAIAQGADLRALIADLTKPYEAKHGPIKTDAIEPRIEQKRPGFNRGSNANPGQETQPAKAEPGCAQYNRDRRRKNIERILPLLRAGLSTEQIGKAIGLTARAVRYIIARDNLREAA